MQCLGRASGWGGTLLAAVACLPALAVAAAASDVDTLLAAAGAHRHLESWPETNVAAREAAKASLPPEISALLLRAVHGAFAAEALLADVSDRVAASLGAEAVAALRLRYETSGASGLLGAPDGIPASELRAFPGFASAVSRREVPPARFRLVARLSDGTGLARNAWRVSGAVGQAILRGAAALRCQADAWRAPLPSAAANRARLAGPFQERVHLELLFLTRERGVAELRRSVRFLESPSARGLHRALGEAIEASLDAALARLRGGLADAVEMRCS